LGQNCPEIYGQLRSKDGTVRALLTAWSMATPASRVGECDKLEKDGRREGQGS